MNLDEYPVEGTLVAQADRLSELKSFTKDQWETVFSVVHQLVVSEQMSDTQLMTAHTLMWAVFTFSSGKTSDILDRIKFVFPDVTDMGARWQKICKIRSDAQQLLTVRGFLDQDKLDGRSLHLQCTCLESCAQSFYEAAISLYKIKCVGNEADMVVLRNLHAKLADSHVHL
jgi:hypothetical protein